MSEQQAPRVTLDQAWEQHPEPGSGVSGPEVDELARKAAKVLGEKFWGSVGHIQIERLVERPDGLYAVWRDTSLGDYCDSWIHGVRRLDGVWKVKER